MLQCPICPRSDIPDEAQQCPSCNTDLTLLQKIRQLSASYFNDAVRLLEAGAPDEALIRLGAALALDRRSARARVLLGKILWQQGRTGAAIRQWKQAATLLPGDAEVETLLKEAQRQVRQRRMWRGAGVAAACVLLAAAVWASATYPARTVANRLDALPGTVARALCQPPGASGEQVRAAAGRSAPLLHIANQTALVRKEVGLLLAIQKENQSCLSELLCVTSEMLALAESFQIEAPRRIKHLRASLAALLETMPPEGAQRLHAAAERLRKQLREVEAQKELQQKQGASPEILAQTNTKIDSLRERLAAASRRYQQRVAPWKRALKELRLPAGTPTESRTSPPTGQRLPR